MVKSACGFCFFESKPLYWYMMVERSLLLRPDQHPITITPFLHSSSSDQDRLTIIRWVAFRQTNRRTPFRCLTLLLAGWINPASVMMIGKGLSTTGSSHTEHSDEEQLLSTANPQTVTSRQYGKKSRLSRNSLRSQWIQSQKFPTPSYSKAFRNSWNMSSAKPKP